MMIISIMISLSGTIPEDVLHPYGAQATQLQINYQRMELEAFAHFGMNTFTGREWGNGSESEKLFCPSQFDPEQWARVLSQYGFKQLIFTAKHHDGFGLWPSKFTNHTVELSKWRNGSGDPVREVLEACQKYGLKPAIYLSPWDMNSSYYGEGDAYNEFYYQTMDELYSNYGYLTEVWMDGAKGDDVEQKYDFDEWFAGIRLRQPDTIIWSAKGPDARWIGNEKGQAPQTLWTPTFYPGNRPEGWENGSLWVVSEADVSIRPGWFYHESEDTKVKTGKQLFDLYCTSVGRNSILLLNIPPNKEGRIHQNDVKALADFQAIRDNTFSTNLAQNAVISAQSVGDNYKVENVINDDYDAFWAPPGKTGTISVVFGKETKFDIVMLQEYIPLGQRVKRFEVFAIVGNEWKSLQNATTIGHKRILRLDAPVTARELRIEIQDALATPLINTFGVFLYDGEV